jgi:hypothetical protein
MGQSVLLFYVLFRQKPGFPLDDDEGQGAEEQGQASHDQDQKFCMKPDVQHTATILYQRSEGVNQKTGTVRPALMRFMVVGPVAE